MSLVYINTKEYPVNVYKIYKFIGKISAMSKKEKIIDSLNDFPNNIDMELRDKEIIDYKNAGDPKEPQEKKELETRPKKSIFFLFVKK
jgi:hypothetical protein